MLLGFAGPLFLKTLGIESRSCDAGIFSVSLFLIRGRTTPAPTPAWPSTPSARSGNSLSWKSKVNLVTVVIVVVANAVVVLEGLDHGGSNYFRPRARFQSKSLNHS